MPRAKRESDRIYNVRRRAKRAMERAKKAGNERLVYALQREIDNTYMDTGTHSYQVGIEQTKRNIAGLIGQEGTASANKKIQRSNAAFLSEMRKASKGLPSNITTRVGFNAELEVDVFFAATRDLWEYVPGGNRMPLQTVAGVLGYDSLEDAYRYIMSQQIDALSRIDALSGTEPVDDITQPTELTFDERYMYVLSYINIMR